MVRVRTNHGCPCWGRLWLIRVRTAAHVMVDLGGLGLQHNVVAHIRVDPSVLGLYCTVVARIRIDPLPWLPMLG